MKKNLLVTISFIFIYLTAMQGQVKVPYEADFFPSAVNIAQTQVKVGQTVKSTTYSQVNDDIGMEVINDTTKNIYRTYFTFNFLQIPTNATITEVKVVYNTNSTGYSFKLTHITTLGTTNSNNWTVIGTSGSIKTGLVYSAYDVSFVSPELKTKIQGLLTSHEIVLGGLSESETTAGSKSDLTFSLHIKWEMPAQIFAVTAQNDMNGWSGGNIGAGVVSASSHPSPYTFPATETVTYKLKAFDNQHNDVNGYDYIYNDTEEAPLNKSEWKKTISNNETPMGATVDQTFQAVSNATYKAYLRKICNLTFTNSFNGISSTGSIKVNGTTVSAPTAQYQVVDGNTIQVEAITQTYNDIKYTFSHWSDNNSTQNPRTITATSHANISAVFIGTPIFTNFGISNRNLHSNTYNPRFPNVPITLYWDLHQSSNVTAYKVRRGANINNVTTWNIIATVSGSTTSYTDNDFLIAASKSTGSIVMYDVKAYYSPDQTVSANESITVYANYDAPVQKIANSDSTSTELPAINEYALNSNYPNPFNPTTQISYQLPENSFVNLVVYNSLGQKVAELVNQHQSVGQYTVKFDASNLPSGVYIYKLQAGEFSSVKKMLLTK